VTGLAFIRRKIRKGSRIVSSAASQHHAAQSYNLDLLYIFQLFDIVQHSDQMTAIFEKHGVIQAVNHHIADAQRRYANLILNQLVLHPEMEDG
jgi:hypothetical protein